MTNLSIRPFAPGDEPALHQVYFSAVHETASKDYTPEQINAWAPASFDGARWAEHIQTIQPFVLEAAGVIVAYADVQPDGYIDHFFVSGPHGQRGFGTLLMRHLLDTARARGLPALSADVSRSAQPFFAQFGFVVVEHRTPVVRGVAIPNALMRCDLCAHHLGKSIG